MTAGARPATAISSKTGVLFGALVLAVLITGVATATRTSAGASPKAIPRASEWIDARHGWTWHYPSTKLYTTDDGGRTWHAVFTGSNFLFNPSIWTSRSAALVSTGRQAGATFWTRDGGRRWYGTQVVPLGAAASGRGSLLFWHQYRDTLYRVEGWPPRGDFPCEPGDWPPAQPPGHRICLDPPGDAGMRSIVAARLERGVFREMRSVAGGVVGLVLEPNGRHPNLGASDVALYREGSLSLVPLADPAVADGEELSGVRLAAAWPRIYVTTSLVISSEPGRRPDEVGSVLWRSGDGGRTWKVTVARVVPKRMALVRGRPRVGVRTWLPGGFVASALARRRRVLLIRQLGRTRLLALRGTGTCSALEPHVDWPQLFVEGRRAGRPSAVWWSPDGGIRWTRFGRC